jgi:hypothetical protein
LFVAWSGAFELELPELLKGLWQVSSIGVLAVIVVAGRGHLKNMLD